MTRSPKTCSQSGTVASIKQVLKLPGGTVRVLVEGLARARVVRYWSWSPSPGGSRTAGRG